MTKSMIKTIIQVIIILAAAVYAVYKFYDITNPNKYDPNEKKIAELCKKSSINLELESVYLDDGIWVYFFRSSSISNSSVEYAVKFFDIISSEEYKDLPSYGKKTDIIVSNYDNTGGGGISLLNYSQSDFIPDKLISFHSSSENLFGTDGLDKIKSDVQRIRLRNAKNIRSDDFMDFTSLKELELYQCTDGTRQYEKADADRFEFYNDDVIFTIS